MNPANSPVAFNRMVKHLAVFLLAFVLLIGCWNPLWADENTTPIQGTISNAQIETVPNQLSRLLQTRLNRLYAFDATPLGERSPLILVPGHAQEFQHNAWWQKFRSQTVGNQAFNKRYKLYVYLYNSNEELPVQSAELILAVRRHLVQEVGSTDKIVFVGYSLGGIIVRQALEDTEVFDATDVAFAVATPFHGSPVFHPRWFSRSSLPDARSPIRKSFDRLLYSSYFFNKHNLIRYLQWDNFDGSMPRLQDLNEKERVQLELSAYRDRTEIRALKKKLIVYASFLENQYIAETRQKPRARGKVRMLVNRAQRLSKVTVGYVLPNYGTSVHSVMGYVNDVMSNLPTHSEEEREGMNQRLYKYNDGVIPLSSMLYLPPQQVPYDGEPEALAAASDVSMVRIFQNLDHLDIGEYRMSRQRLSVGDLMHPHDGIRSPNAWILHDLQVRQGELL